MTPRILIVDDDADQRELLVALLESGGYQTVMAASGEEAWDVLTSRPHDFDAVLLDRVMPDMDGIQVLRRLKKHDLLKELPVIIQTVADERKEIIEGIQAGAFYYLAKPIDRQVLMSVVQAAVADLQLYRRLQEEVRQQHGAMLLMRQSDFDFRTLSEASDLGTFLARACPDPERVVLGLTELLVNSVEHGNLEISYQEKSVLQRSGRWLQEIDSRLAREPYCSRVATIRFDRSPDEIVMTITDEGAGFDWRPFLQIDPGRAFDSHGRGIAIAKLVSFDHLEYTMGGRRVIAQIRLVGD